MLSSSAIVGAAGRLPLSLGRMTVADRAILVEFDAHRLDELIHMWRASFEAGVGVIDPHPLSEQRQYFLTEVLPRNVVCLAIHADALVGFIAASAESVAQLYVRVGCQRRGVGAQLLTWAKERSTGKLWLYTYARNLGARAFYERNGFVAIAHGFEPMLQLEDIKYQWTVGTHNAA
jgi:GNAT superfamily N-acetyltransferase